MNSCPSENIEQNYFAGSDGKEHNLLELCEAYFNAKPGGNVDPRKDPHGELKFQNVLTNIDVDSKQILADFGFENEAGLQEKIKQMALILFEERQKRPRPHLDDKILTCWNGLMISAFAIAGQALKNQDYIDTAVRACEFIKTKMFNTQNGTLLRSIYTQNKEGVEQLSTPIHGFADDYAYLIQGLIGSY